jgi:hypothetical protein
MDSFAFEYFLPPSLVALEEVEGVVLCPDIPASSESGRLLQRP